MITLTCDNCDKPFQIEDEAAGEKVACPYCGDINRVPEAAVVGVPMPAAQAAGTTAHAQPVSTSSLAAAAKPAAAADAEKEIAVVRQAMFRAHPFLYLLMVALFLGGIILAVLTQTLATMAGQPWLLWLGLGLAAVAIVWYVIWWAAPHRWIKLTITNKRTIRQEGIVVRKTSEVMHRDVTNVSIRQGFLQRLLGVGYIGIDSAGQGGEVKGEKGDRSRQSTIEIEVENVPHPYRIKDIIDRYR